MRPLTETVEDLANEEEAALAVEKKEKDSPKGNGAGELLLTVSGPGEQGSATQEGDTAADGEDKYVPPKPSAEEVRTAEEVFADLQSQGPRHIGAERTIDALLQVVDRHPQFVCPMDWMGEEDEKYRSAHLVERIGGLLLQACPKLEISQRSVIYVWRNHEKWQSKGVTIRSKPKSLGGMTRFLVDGASAVVEVNFHAFKHLNPLQKVATVYHALRALDGEGKQRPVDFAGFFDELKLFGAGTFREMVTMANALERGKDVSHPHQLSLLDEVEDTEAAARG